MVRADRRAVSIKRQTSPLTVNIITPWALEAIRSALAVMRREDDLTIKESRTLREKLDIDVLEQLMDTAAASGGGASNSSVLTVCFVFSTLVKGRSSITNLSGRYIRKWFGENANVAVSSCRKSRSRVCLFVRL